MIGEGTGWKTAFAVIFSIILVNVIVIISYKKCTKKENDDYMSTEISGAISNYFQLSGEANDFKKMPVST
jgi:hypothetical protein